MCIDYLNEPYFIGFVIHEIKLLAQGKKVDLANSVEITCGQ